MTDHEPLPTIKLGQILLKEGYIQPPQLDKALAIFKSQQDQQAYKPFGQICLELNYLSAEELQRLLRKYKKRIRLGELLVNQGLIKQSQLNQALHKQKTNPQRLGTLLLEAGLITSNQLMTALSLQLDIPRITPSTDLIDQSLLAVMPMDFWRKHLCLPISRSDRELTVVMDNPTDADLLLKLAKSFKATVIPALSPPEAIKQTLQALQQKSRSSYQGAESQPAPQAINPYQLLSEVEAEGIESHPTLDLSTPLFGDPESENVTLGETVLKRETHDENSQEDQVVNFLIKNAMKDRATSIHIEPQENHIRIRYRIDGILHHKTDLPTHLGPLMTRRLKNLCNLDTSLPGHQRGRVAGSFNNQELDLQIATYSSLWGESVSIEVQEKQSSLQEMLLNLERIGFSPLHLLRYQHILDQPGGFIIVTGPARSGKTSTLYASVNYLNQQNRSIITAENPIEIHVPGLVQGQFQAEVDLRFANQIAAMKYLDPDILMVSEIDGPETLEAVVEAALSGAKILSTYQAFDATGTLLRLSRMGLENYLIASSQITVLSQRLVRKLCDLCKQAQRPRQETLNRLGLVDVIAEQIKLYIPVGCEACNQRGFKGQTAIHELFQLNEAMREAILDHKPAATIRGIARTETKLVSMAEDGFYKALEGITSLEEVQRVAFVNEYDSQTPWEAEEIRSICRGLEPEFF